tara:strand:- start:611 stop:838 length:228 start_codon:yes stop_codon:yes gene_type:complete
MSGNYKKVEGHAHILKDVERGTVINNNGSEIDAARLRKKSKIKLKEESVKLKNDVQSLKDEMSDIKSLLKQILEK